jgi:SAM-dependent methyltransferase
MLGLDAWQTGLFVFLILICVSYLWTVFVSKLSEPVPITYSEGFTNAEESEANKSKYEWLTGDEVYDDFYMQVHHKIFQHEKLVQAECAIALQDWKKRIPINEMSVLDVACGSGVGATYFAKQGVASSVGIDKSPSAIRYAKNTIVPASTLDPKQKDSLELKVNDIYSPSACTQAEFTHTILPYFSVYGFRDLDTVFRNLYFWTKPGGSMAIECVNRDKFDPIPNVANPFVGASLQAHAKQRVTRGEAVFDKFNYSSEFDLNESKAEYKETFRFKDGTVRRQKQILYMPTMKEIVSMAQNAGWIYDKFTELSMIGFDYGYLLFFNRA